MDNLLKRSEIDDAYKWKMEDVYKDLSEYRSDVDKVKKMFQNVEKYRGIICRDVDNFRECMKIISEIEYLTEKIYFYANQKYHEDMSVAESQTLSNEASVLLTSFYTISSFVEPELTDCDEKVIDAYLENEDLVEYRQYFNDLFRQKKHILSKEIESVLAQTQKLSQASGDIFQVFNNADIEFPIIKDEDGNDVRLTHGRLNLFLESKNREVRKAAFDGLYKTYGAFRNTLAAIYIASVKKDNFYSEIRRFSSSREMYLEDGNIPGSVYDNLIKTVNSKLPLLHRYVELRKKALKLDEVHLYDMYVPMTENHFSSISYDKAKKMVIDGLKPMGEEYVNLLKKGFNEGWIDVYENAGKRSGAYSWSVYGIHPYVLLNYQPDLNSVFTIAHEMGHALHSYYSNSNQTYTNAEYKIFVAEVASTCNESLLIQYLINNSKNDDEKAYLINHFLEQFRTTLFRQTMFAEFEDIVHKLVDSGESLNCELLCDKYYELNKKYFGANIVIDKEIEMEWARIPHFYNAFYVYQYATGFSAAIALSDKILNEGENAVNDYKKFLKGGCTKYPIDLLKMAGVDMSSREPIEKAMDVFEILLDQFEKLID